MSGPAAYHCSIHGRKLVPVGRSKAPATKPCPECLKAHADSVGMSIAEVIDALTQDIGGGE